MTGSAVRISDSSENVAVIKAASTLPLATDPAMVVTIRDAIASTAKGAANPTYCYFSGGYTGYTTPTDMWSLSGSSTKLVIPTTLIMLIQSTSATLTVVDFVKRSTLNTGGTPSVLTPVKNSSADASATAVLTSYASAPTLGTTVGTVASGIVMSGTLTAAPGISSFSTMIANSSPVSNSSQLVLRNQNESICANFKGAALPAGFTAYIVAQWIEV